MIKIKLQNIFTLPIYTLSIFINNIILQKTKETFYLKLQNINIKYKSLILKKIILVELHNIKSKSRNFNKSRGNLNYSTKKKWRQKGTGRARVGSFKSLQFRGKVNAFPFLYAKRSRKINKKEKLLALNLVMFIRLNDIFIIKGPWHYNQQFNKNFYLNFNKIYNNSYNIYYLLNIFNKYLKFFNKINIIKMLKSNKIIIFI
uniref:Large ribosomal subunit protein uL4m n=1 Tax=Piridium sociabile TaxID=2570542 RepID=A0A5B9XXL0_9ALVE|nr:ribosomal protein L4 [Piridium sociabile]